MRTSRRMCLFESARTRSRLVPAAPRQCYDSYSFSSTLASTPSRLQRQFGLTGLAFYIPVKSRGTDTAEQLRDSPPLGAAERSTTRKNNFLRGGRPVSRLLIRIRGGRRGGTSPSSSGCYPTSAASVISVEAVAPPGSCLILLCRRVSPRRLGSTGCE